MPQSARFLSFAALMGTLTVAGALAQSAPAPSQPSQNQPAAQTQPGDPSQTQSSDQYSGVAHPPPDSTIQADEDMTPAPPPATPPAAKPSAAIPMTPAPAAQPAPRAVAPAASTIASPTANPKFAGEIDNTDSGIVTVVAPESEDASLQRRAPDGDEGLVSNAAVNPNDLSAGTRFTVRLTEDLSTKDTQPGSPFHATVAHDVYNGARLVIPSGSELRGRVADVSQGHHFGPHAEIRLRPEAVVLPDGTAYHLYAEVVQTDAPGTHTDDEGGILASSHFKKDAVEYGGGVGTGAVVGAVVAGPVGAGVGTLVGAGAVTTHMLLQSPQAADLPQGSLLVFSLTEPLALTPTKN